MEYYVEFHEGSWWLYSFHYTHTRTHARAYLVTNHYMHSCLAHFYFTIVHWRQNFRVLYFFCFCSINLVMEFHKTETWPVVV
jgi:hypothetical protein